MAHGRKAKARSKATSNASAGRVAVRGGGAAAWDVHPGVRMVAEWVKTLRRKTGRSVDEWVALVVKDGPADEKGRRDWLRKEHGLPMTSAWWIAEKSCGGGTWDEDDATYLRAAAGYVDELFAGPRAAARPLFDEIVALARSFGGGVRVCPCRTMVPFYRKHVFAEVRPMADGVELALALGDVPARGRLEERSRNAGDRLNRRVRLRAGTGVDAEVEGWLRAAWERGDRAQERKISAGPPPDLAAMLARSKAAAATWDTMTPRMRSDWVAFIESAKKAETRAARVARAGARLAAGKKSTY